MENQVTPIYIGKLKEKIGAKAVAEKIGCSAGYICTSIGQNQITLTYELAARFVFEKEYGATASDNKCAILHAPPHVIKTISDLVGNIGGKFHIIP